MLLFLNGFLFLHIFFNPHTSLTSIFTRLFSPNYFWWKITFSFSPSYLLYLTWAVHSLVFQLMKLTITFLPSLRKKNKSPRSNFYRSFTECISLKSWRLIWIDIKFPKGFTLLQIWMICFLSLFLKPLIGRKKLLPKAFSLKGICGHQRKVSICPNPVSVFMASDIRTMVTFKSR